MKRTSIQVHLSSNMAGAEAQEERGLHQGWQDQSLGALVSECFLREARGQFQQGSSNMATRQKEIPDELKLESSNKAELEMPKLERNRKKWEARKIDNVRRDMAWVRYGIWRHRNEERVWLRTNLPWHQSSIAIHLYV